MDAQEISLDTPLAELGSTLLVETEAGRTLVKRVGRKGTQTLTAHLPDGRRTTLGGIPGERTLRQAVAAASSARPLRAFALPSGEIEAVHRPIATAAAFLPWLIGGGAALAGMLMDSLGLLRFILLGVGITILILTHDAFDKGRRYRQWAIAREEERATALEIDLPPLAEEIEVDDVKEEYGRLLSDVVFRIENPALFDPHEPTSKEFTLALLQWDNNDGLMSRDERIELARRVRATFAAARANAERIGMAHLPEAARDRASTALKAARLAADEAAPAPERETALKRAVEILDGLALYYLPSGAQARRAITKSGPPQLPGRRSV